MKIFDGWQTNGILIAMIGVISCAFLTWPGNVTAIDGAGICGGSDKFVCKNLCTQVAGSGCVASQNPPIDCVTSPAGTVCGEAISKVYTVNGCVVDPAGNVDPCVNDKPEAKCYRAKNCVCKIKNYSGTCVTTSDRPSDRGSANGSANCP